MTPDRYARDLARHLRRRRAADIAAYALVVGGATAGPLWLLVVRARLPPGVAATAGLGVTPLSVLWVVLWLLGRPRSVEGLGAGLFVGGAYYAAAGYAAWQRDAGLLGRLAGEDIAFGVLFAIVTAFFVTLQHARKGDS